MCKEEYVHLKFYNKGVFMRGYPHMMKKASHVYFRCNQWATGRGPTGPSHCTCSLRGVRQAPRRHGVVLALTL